MISSLIATGAVLSFLRIIDFLGRTAGAVILRISHGYTIREDGDPLLEMANKVKDTLSVTMIPGRFLVDMLPICTFYESL